jgi:hypothetical protein
MAVIQIFIKTAKYFSQIIKSGTQRWGESTFYVAVPASINKHKNKKQPSSSCSQGESLLLEQHNCPSQ